MTAVVMSAAFGAAYLLSGVLVAVAWVRCRRQAGATGAISADDWAFLVVAMPYVLSDLGRDRGWWR